MSKPVALTIAGSDPSGGAGLQADLKTFAAHGVYGVSATTVLTAQNERRFEILPVSLAFIGAQIDALFEEFQIDAIKIGMLANQQTVQAVINALQRHNRDRAIMVVVDPILRASNGGMALDERGMVLLRDELFPLANLIKPNLAEAALLLGEPVANNPQQMSHQAASLLQFGCECVLLSGGHLAGPDCVDVLAHASGCATLYARKLDVGEVHGTGCTLTSAITANLAKGHVASKAVDLARTYLQGLLAQKHQLNRNGVARSLDHLFITVNKSEN
ncbi:MAG: bifunctional hydroxymethylpyrimidine kinase/phosphomethylpyrimidine kinase [bacterium]|nr:bifunctional hydroxymethylpyrimidine kinase/phosphomethylpyrimidine kinase [bacterium]